MKYDILKASDDHQHDLIIETFFEYSSNPYIFNKLNLEQSLRILSSEILEISYCRMILLPRLKNDQVDIFGLVKNPNILATIEGDWNKQSAIHLLRLKKCIYQSDFDLINEISFFPDFIKIDNDHETAYLVEEFIDHSYALKVELDRKINQYWLSLVRSFLSITLFDKESAEDSF